MSQNEDKRIIIYPDYINAVKTVAQGRRIPKELAVEWPTAVEMIDACVKGMGLQAEYERKMYSRNWTVEQGKELCFGRVRVALRKPDGSPVNPEVPTRRELMVRMAELVRRHPDRTSGAKKGAAAAASSSGAAAGGKQSGKKSGKKKK